MIGAPTNHDGEARPLVPVLMYHSISSGSTPAFGSFVTEPARFAEQMATLAEEKFQPITMSQYVAGMWSNGSLSEKSPVVLTFDDAFQDFYTTALPILAEFHFAATLYVPTDYVGQTSRWLSREGEAGRRMMSWEALREAAAMGIEVGSHSRSHPQLDLVSKTRLESEIVDSKRELEQQLQQRVDAFAYPFGYFNSAVRRAVVDAGYTSACAVRNLADVGDDAFSISRLVVRNGLCNGKFDRLLVRADGPLAGLRANAGLKASRVLRRIGVTR